MLKILCGALLLKLNSIALAEDDEWVYSSGNNENSFYMKKRSFEIASNKKGEQIALVIGRVIDLKTNLISLEKWYVKTKDCYASQGLIVTTTLAGEYKFENEFIFGGGSIASANAELICKVLAQTIKDYNEQQSKGI